MKTQAPVATDAANAEIAALIETLRATSQRLEVLTGGEVDSIADADGRTYLLRGVHQHLRNVDAAKQAAILNALPANIALLDEDGLILTVNEGWRHFAALNALHCKGNAIGVNYLEICDHAVGDGAAEAHQAAAGLRSVLEGAVKTFSLEYPCPSPTEERWFLMTVTPLADDRLAGAVVMHTEITERKLGEQALRRFGAAMNATVDAIYVVDRSTMRFVHVNDAACQMTQHTREALLALGPGALLAISRAELEVIYDDVIAGGAGGKSQELLRRRADGSQVWVELRRHAYRSGNRWAIVTLVRDITERKAAADRIAHLNRVYAMLSGINALIVHVRSRDELYREACRVAVEAGGFRMAWIAMGDRVRRKVVPVASAGMDEELLTALKDHYSLAGPGSLGNTRAARAISEKRVIVVNDLVNNSTVAFGKEFTDRGIGSMAVLPLIVSNEAVGALVLYARENAFFHQEEIKLLTALTGDVAFAIGHIEKEEKIARLSRIEAVMSGINAVIVRVRDRQELFDEACRVAVEDGGFGTAWIGLFDAATLEVSPVAWSGVRFDEGSVPARTDVMKSQGSVARAIRQKRPAFDNDIAAPTSSGGLRRAFAVKKGFRSLAALPFVVEDAVVGHLSLYTREPDFFTDDELKLLTDLAGNISFALAQIGREEKIARLSRIQALMSGINALIVRVRDQQLLLEEACRIAVEQGGFGIAWIGMLDRKTQQILAVAVAGSEAGPLSTIGHYNARPDTPRGQGFVGRAFREKRPVLSNDLAAETTQGGAARQEATRRGYRSHISLPLIVEDEAVGNLSLYAKESNFFNQEEIGLMSEVAGNVSFALELIQKNAALEALAQKTARRERILNTALSSMKDFAQVYNREGHVVFANQPLLTLWGLTLEAVEGKNFFDLGYEDEVARKLQRQLQEVFATKQSITDETPYTSPAGSPGYYEYIFSPVFTVDGSVDLVVGSTRDITERKHAEGALRELNDQLEAKVFLRTVDVERARHDAENANQAKSTFLAAMSHEIRTPMNGVVGMIDVLHQSSLKGDQVEMVDLIRESAFSLLGIINDILDFSKIEAGKLELESEVVALGHVVESVCNLLNGMAEKKGVVLTLFTDPAIPLHVLGDALRVRQVLINLVNNSIKFSSGQLHPGRVAVRAMLIERSAELVTVEFQVIDNGIGMDEATQARLFTAFSQADATTTRRFGGTGLGLAIAGNLVDLMGGTITVESAPGAGSTFRVRVPFAALSAGSHAVAEASEVAGVSCVVIGAAGGLADDFAAYLEHAGASVERVPNLRSAAQRGPHQRGLSVWIVDAGQAPQPAEQIRAAARERGGGADVRFVFVLVERGKRRQPRAVTDDLVTVDGNVLSRRTFLKAVAVACGRASLDIDAEKSSASSLPAVAPSRAEALRLRQLILIAEDNETNQKVIMRQLALLGYTADIAADGREALARWHSGDYALLLTDLHMPHMDGYELTEAIRSEERGGRRLPIIALTANALKGEAEHCRAVGMDDYRSKPSPLTELKSVLDKWLPAGHAEADAGVLSALTTATTVPPIAAAPLDVSVLEGLVGDDAALVSEFLQDFQLSAARIALELRAACAAAQPKAAAAAAHKLKSSALAVGAFALSDLCTSVEVAGHAGDSNSLNELLPCFEAEMALVKGYLNQRLANMPVASI